MLRKADKIFLQQLHEFTYMNHPVGAIGLYGTGVKADTTAGLGL